MKKQLSVLIIIIAFSFALSAYFYPRLPETIVTHWGMSGEANGYSSKLLGLFFFPILLSVLSLISVFLPKIDPFKENVKKFWRTYMGFIVILCFFMLYLQLLVITWNRGVEFEFIRFLSPAFTILFFYIGILLKKSKRNWFIGIRTPWTLHSDAIWNKTHALASKLFQATALVCLGGVVWPDFGLWFVFVPVVLSSLGTYVYSYMLYSSSKK